MTSEEAQNLVECQIIRHDPTGGLYVVQDKCSIKDPNRNNHWFLGLTYRSEFDSTSELFARPIHLFQNFSIVP